MAKLQAIRGMNDVLPDQTAQWQHIEATLSTLMKRFAYHEIRFPILEKTELFKRTIGEVTDIVEKEMYCFEDRNGDHLSLRPEGTAGCVRAGIEHGLFYNQTQRLYYSGPFYRHERPQKGRYRQFHQLGVEAFGFATPDIDAEIILLTSEIFKTFGLEQHLTLHLNSMGSTASRAAYRRLLVDYLNQHEAALDEDSQRRLHTNPLRILDSKNPDMTNIIDNAPKMIDHLDASSKEHFEAVCHHLDQLGIQYVLDPTIVRGLDYYNDTVFEWVSTELGAQGTVCAGGRYNGLVAQLGGHDTPAMGFALGMERLLALLEQHTAPTTPTVDAFLIITGEKAQQQSLLIAQQLREALPSLSLHMNAGSSSLKSQLKKADKSGARVALILGDDEVEKGQITIKFLREDQPQQTLDMANIIKHL